MADDAQATDFNASDFNATDPSDTDLSAARRALERGEYGRVLALLEPLAERHPARTALGSELRLLIVTALMGQGESERAAACCRSLRDSVDPELRARARDLLYVLEAPALSRPRAWSLTLPDLAPGPSLESVGRPGGRRRRPQELPPPPPPPPVGPTRAPLGFAALAGLLLVVMLLAGLLGGCVQVRSELRFDGPGRVQVSHRLRSAAGSSTPWQRHLAGDLAELGFRPEGRGEQRILRTAVLPAREGLTAFAASVQRAARLGGVELPPLRLELRERNWLLGVRQRLSLEIDLTALEPLPGLELELGLAPLRPAAVRRAAPEAPLAENHGVRWPLRAGVPNRLEVSSWRWSPLGLGGAAVLLAVIVALALQRIRQSLGFGLPQLPA
jgi:hypothetical protein